MQMKLHILSTTREYFGVIAARYILNDLTTSVSDLFQWLGGPKKNAIYGLVSCKNRVIIAVSVNRSCRSPVEIGMLEQ